jgi:L-seryl-tRNA(Ser) seleniumtransferase
MGAPKNMEQMLSQLPQVHGLLESDEAAALLRGYAHGQVRDGIRRRLDALREEIQGGAIGEFTFSPASFWKEVAGQLAAGQRKSLRRVINGTGIIIHTNLGRSPLAAEAIADIAEVAGRYSTLELDVASGKRGSRYSHVERLLCSITGAEAAVVVNNNAAAVILVLNTLAPGGEAVISRGELVEIGGAFRIPDVIVRSGAKMAEVGATNRTRIEDYESAINDNTRVLLKVHPSNFRVVGFTAEAPREAIAALAKARGIVSVEDLGSGTLIDLERFGLPHEPTVQEALAAGMDVVTFSGDKLMGGPQAGIIVGKTDLINTMKKNPLIRALRIDKLSLAALEGTLRLYENDDEVARKVPVMQLLSQDLGTLRERAQRMHDGICGIAHLAVSLREGVGFAGGGALPEEGIPTCVVALAPAHRTVDDFAEAMRANDPPIIGRVVDDCFALDLRTILDDEVDEIICAVQRIVS